MLELKKKLSSVRLIIIAISAYITIDIYVQVFSLFEILLPFPTHFCDEQFCYWIEAFLDVISFGFTGFLLGICLWLLYEKSAKQLVKFIPLFGLLALYIWTNRTLQEFSQPVGAALDIAIQRLVSAWGVGYFVFLPLSVFATILLVEKYSYKQIARAVALVFAVLISSRFIYQLTPQYQQEQEAKAKTERRFQQSKERLQHELDKLQESQRRLDELKQKLNR